MEDYGLPKPDHEVLTAHPSVSGEFLTRLGCGDVTVKGGLESLDGDGVRFADGSREEIDVIIWATGYRISFPFLRQNSLAVEDNKFPLYRRMVKPGWRNRCRHWSIWLSSNRNSSPMCWPEIMPCPMMRRWKRPSLPMRRFISAIIMIANDIRSRLTSINMSAI